MKNEVTSHYVSVPPLHARKVSVPQLFFVIVHQWTVQTVQNHKFLTKNHPPRVLKELHSLRFCSLGYPGEFNGCFPPPFLISFASRNAVYIYLSSCKNGNSDEYFLVIKGKWSGISGNRGTQ